MHHFIAGRCIGDDCSAQVCADCLTKVSANLKCSCCGEVTNFMCNSCVTKHHGRHHQFDYCRNECGFICPQHSSKQACNVCDERSFCNGPSRTCEIGTCGRCGDNLCDRCSYKEGCMCEEDGYGGGGSERGFLDEFSSSFMGGYGGMYHGSSGGSEPDY
jgi:hypothetical protein